MAVGDERQASWLELFFDLVLVAAVAALAAQLHADHSLTGLAVFAGLFVPVWWAWWGFTWYSSAFDDDDAVNRLAFLAAMAGVAALAAGIPGAAHGRSDTFVVAYGGLFAVLAALYARASIRVPAARALSARYAIGDAVGAAVWLASLALDGNVRPVLWVAAMVVLMGSPVLAAASMEILSYDTRHIAERYGLFTLIVLGESVVAVVAGLDTGSSTRAVIVALLGLVIAAAVWWLYFDRWRSMPAGSVRSGFVWAQGHVLVFAGIASAATGVHPRRDAPHRLDRRPAVDDGRRPLRALARGARSGRAGCGKRRAARRGVRGRPEPRPTRADPCPDRPAARAATPTGVGMTSRDAANRARRPRPRFAGRSRRPRAARP